MIAKPNSVESGWARVSTMDRIRPWIPRLVVGAILAYVGVATFPGLLRPISPGLDPSWVYGINQLPYTEFLFGRDVVFTYGPLGYLLVPLDIGSNLTQALVLWILAHVALLAIGVYHFRRHRNVWALAGFGAGYLLAGSFNLPEEYRMLVVLSALLTVRPKDRWVWWSATPAAAVLAGVLLFTKFTTGIAAAVLVVAVGIVWTIGRAAGVRDVVLAFLAPYLGTVVLLGLVLMGSPATFLEWLGRGLELSGGVAVAVSVPEAPVLRILALSAGVAFLVGLVFLARGDPTLRLATVLTASVVLFAYRHGFVRHYGRFVYAVLLGGLAVIMLVTAHRKRLVGLAALALALAVVGLVAFRDPRCLCRWEPTALGPARGWSNFVAVLDLEARRGQLAARSRRELATDRLPADWVSEIRGAGRGVDAIPEEIAFAPANGLRWQPNPVIQTYLAFTRGLDRWVAEHFAGPDGPGHILVEFTDVDARHPMFAAPSMWRAIMSNYEPARPESATGRFGEVLLLRRRPNLAPLRLSAIARVTVMPGRWVEIPSRGDLVFAGIDLRPTLLGRAASLLWRIDPVLIDLQFENDAVRTYRFLPPTASGGLLLNRPPQSIDGLADLLEGRLPPEVERFRVHGPGIERYEAPFEVVWQTARWMP